MKKVILFFVVTLLVTFLVFLSGCTDDSKKAENSIINTQNSTQNNTQNNTQVNLTSQVTYKLTLDDIKKKYSDSKILSIQNINEDFVLIESQQATFANRFDLYNLRTGSMDNLPTMPEFVTLEKVENENYFVFSASGKNSESPFSVFPYTIKCFRIKNDLDKNDNFTAVYEDKYFSLDESVQAGSKEGSIMSDLNITFEGLEVMFRPIKGKETGFYADTTDIPPIKTSYDKVKKQITFEIGTNQLGESLNHIGKVNTEKNPYISSYVITQKNNKIYLIVSIRDSAKRYTAKVVRLPNGNMPDGFPYFEVQFNGEE